MSHQWFPRNGIHILAALLPIILTASQVVLAAETVPKFRLIGSDTPHKASLTRPYGAGVGG